MGTGGDFGNDAAKIRVQFSLAENFIGQNFGRLPVCLAYHGRSCVVAAAFDAKDREGICQGLGLLCGALATGNTFDMVQTIPPTVLLTRPKAASERFAASLSGSVVISPVQEILWREALIPNGVIDGVVFTSQNGVEGFARSQTWRGPAFCVGDRTAQAASAAGFQASSAGGDVADLKELLKEQGQDMRLVHARGLHVAGNLGDLAEPMIVYAQGDLALSDEARKLLKGMETVIVPLFSPRTAQAFAQQLGKADCAPLVVIAMSAAVAQTCEEAGVHVDMIAKSPDGNAMLRAVEAATS